MLSYHAWRESIGVPIGLLESCAIRAAMELVTEEMLEPPLREQMLLEALEGMDRETFDAFARRGRIGERIYFADYLYRQLKEPIEALRARNLTVTEALKRSGAIA
jgi:hypothetical protein